MQTCPGCSGKLKLQKGSHNVYDCQKCGGLVSDGIYLGDSYRLVLPYFETEDVPPAEWRYFDLTCLGSEGITRRHGWYWPESRRILQVG